MISTIGVARSGNLYADIDKTGFPSKAGKKLRRMASKRTVQTPD